MNKFVKFLMAAVLFTTSALTVKAEEYRYTVTVYAGNVGILEDDRKSIDMTIDGSGHVAFLNTKYQITNEKYYLKGYRIAGSDTSRSKYQNLSEVTDTTFDLVLKDVDCDTDLILVYGVRAKKIEYQVIYVDQTTGQQLAPASTFTGSAGDNPIASAVYVEGYVPVFNLATKTLKEGADNTITFYYNPSETVVVDHVTTQVKTETTTIVTTRVDGTVVVDPTKPTVPINDVVTPEGNQPTESGTVIDENETPGADVDLPDDGKDPTNEEGKTPIVDDGKTPTSNENLIKGGGIAVAGGSLITLIIMFILFGRKRKKGE